MKLSIIFSSVVHLCALRPSIRSNGAEEPEAREPSAAGRVFGESWPGPGHGCHLKTYDDGNRARAEWLCNDHPNHTRVVQERYTHAPEPSKLIVVNSHHGPFDLGQCPHQCEVTNELARIGNADAVVWNFCNPKPGWRAEKKPKKRPGQKWIFNYNFEAPNVPWCENNYGKYSVRKMFDRYGPLIDMTMTFHTDSDFVESAFRMEPNPPGDGAGKGASHISLQPKNWSEGRDKMMLWFVSNCGGERLAFGRKLQAMFPPGQVDIFGKCGDTPPCSRDEAEECNQNMFARYHFYAAFENRRCNGYITEKALRAYNEHMVPIMIGGLGRHDYEAIGLPSTSFAHVDDFDSLEALADFMNTTSLNHTKYNSFFAWHSTHQLAQARGMCELCRELHTEGLKPKHNFSLKEWWGGSCK